MLPFSVTIPATVPQRSEIPEGLMNVCVCTGIIWPSSGSCEQGNEFWGFTENLPGIHCAADYYVLNYDSALWTFIRFWLFIYFRGINSLWKRIWSRGLSSVQFEWRSSLGVFTSDGMLWVTLKSEAVCSSEETKPTVRRKGPKDDGRYYDNGSKNSKACICMCLHNKYSRLCLVYLHRTLVDVPMANGLPPAATWAASAASAKACCGQNEGKELVDITANLNEGITQCLDTYYKINIVHQHNCFLLHKVIT